MGRVAGDPPSKEFAGKRRDEDRREDGETAAEGGDIGTRTAAEGGDIGTRTAAEGGDIARRTPAEARRTPAEGGGSAERRPRRGRSGPGDARNTSARETSSLFPGEAPCRCSLHPRRISLRDPQRLWAFEHRLSERPRERQGPAVPSSEAAHVRAGLNSAHRLG